MLLENFFTGNSFHIEGQSSLWPTLGNSDIIVLGAKNTSELLNEMARFQKITEYNFSSTDLYVISESASAKTYLSKVLAKSVRALSFANVHIISKDQLSTLLGRWSAEENRDATIGEPLSYEKNHYSFTMNSFLEYLSYAGVSYDFLGFLLMLSVVALAFNILKQVVGLDTFTLYYPFLLAIIIAQMGYVFTGMFSVAALLSVFLTRIITNKILLLLNAKKAFLISLYTLISLAMLGVDNLFEFGIFDYTIFQNSIPVIAIFAILFIMERLFENIQHFTKSGWLHLLRYVVIVVIAVAIFSWQDLKNFLISYPDVIFLIVIANLLVGRYTGLQVVEYIRFSPILRNINEEE